MSSYTEGQVQQLANALEAAGFTADHLTKLGQYRVLGDFLLVIEGRAEIRPIIVEPAVDPELSLDFIIRVDRSVRPAYPDGVKQVLHPELEGTGLAKYDLQTEVEEWLYDDQKNGSVTGRVIYDHLKASGELAAHLGLADLMAIQQKGVAVFRKLSAGKAVFGWKSVVRDRRGGLCVPFLCEHGDEVVLLWGWLDGVWGSGSPALRFRK